MTKHKTYKVTALLFILVAGMMGENMTAGAINHNIVVRITDEQTGYPVEYPHVSLKNNITGTIGDEHGIAVLKLTQNITKDTLKVSCIGFTPKVIPVDLKLSNDTVSVHLKKRFYNFPAVTVNPPRKKKYKTVGKRHSFGMIGAFTDRSWGKGHSVGWEIEDRGGGRTYLAGMGFYIITDTITESRNGISTTIYPLSSARYRINIYNAANARNYLKEQIRTGYDNVQSEPIIVYYSIERVKDGKFTWNFPEPILLPEKAMVEIELLEDYPDDERIYFKSNVFGRTILCRKPDSYNDYWVKLNVAFPFFLNLVEEFY